MAYLYRHIRLDTNVPFYIGIGSDTNYKRAYYKHGRNRFWKFVVSKTNYEVDILIDGISREYACLKEAEFVKLYGRSNIGTGTLCNLTDGGEGMLGYTTSQATRDKISIALKGKIVSQETRHKLSISLTGKRKSAEAIQKNSKNKMGIKYSDERNMAISTTLKLKYASGERVANLIGIEFYNNNRSIYPVRNTFKHSIESKNKMSIAAMGNKNNIGRVTSVETKSKIGLSNRITFLKKKNDKLDNKIRLAIKSLENNENVNIIIECLKRA